MQKIIFTGPESTGKSILSKATALAFQTLWVPEYARFYLSRLKRPYAQQDILQIAQGQMQWEKVWEKQARGLLCLDTALLVPKIWSEVKYNSVDPWITEQLRRRERDFYFLCQVDLPWEYDPLREHPHLRDELFERYRQALEQMQADYVILSGSLKERKQSAILHIREKFPHLCDLV